MRTVTVEQGKVALAGQDTAGNGEESLVREPLVSECGSTHAPAQESVGVCSTRRREYQRFERWVLGR